MNIGPMEIAIILFLIVLLFGAKKLPDLARSVGRSARIFKAEVKEMKEDDAKASSSSQQRSEEDFWDAPENQPRPIEQAKPNIQPDPQAQINQPQQKQQ